VHERRKVTVKRKRKTVTVTKSFTKLVDQDFTWKDPKAAEKAGMPMMDYVIGRHGSELQAENSFIRFVRRRRLGCRLA